MVCFNHGVSIIYCKTTFLWLEHIYIITYIKQYLSSLFNSQMQWFHTNQHSPKMSTHIALMRQTVIANRKGSGRSESIRNYHNIIIYHKILCITQIITLELGYPCMLYANNYRGEKSTCIMVLLLMTLNLSCLL